MSEGQNTKPLIFLLDLGISTMASLFAVLLIRLLVSEIFGYQHIAVIWVLLSGAFSSLAFWITHTYRIVIQHSTYRSISSIALATLIKSVCQVLLTLTGLMGITNPTFAWGLVIADFLLSLVMMVFVRVFIVSLYESANRAPEASVGKLNVMIYGTSSKSAALVTRLESSAHYNVQGFVTTDPLSDHKIIFDRKVFYVKDAEDVRKLKVSHGFEGLLFAHSSDMSEAAEGLLKMCINSGIHILVAPSIDNVDSAYVSGASQDVTGTNRPVNVDGDDDFIADGMTGFERLTKRVVDFCLSGVLLIIFSPLFLICYIALKVGDKGPAIYKQERIGRFGKPFMIYKFRSMRMDAEADGPALLQGEKDPRLTKVGGFLRAHHLDELPQLFNVFKGDMAFVGHRPERKYFIDQIMAIDPRYKYLYQIRPGVTSYATLNNGYTDTIEKMVRRLEFDLYYLRNRSWWFDIKVLFLTFANIAFGKKL